MKRMMIISTMLVAMSMASFNASAQVQGRGHEKNRVEHRNSRKSAAVRRNPGKDKDHSVRHARPAGKVRHAHVAHAPKPRHDRHFVPRGGRLVKCAPPSIARGCYVPGWEGRVRYHHDGRWAYYVDGCWRYYDCYYNPYEFFCEPVPPHVHHSPRIYVGHPSAGEVAAGVVAGTILGCIIGSMAN